MKRFLFILGLLLPVWAAQAGLPITSVLAGGRLVMGGSSPIALINHISAKSTDGGNSVTSIGINTSGANALFVAVCDYQAAGAGVLTDSYSNTWVARTSYNVPSQTRVTIYYCLSATVGTGHTFTNTHTTGGPNYPSIYVCAFSGVAVSSAFDVENGSGASSVASIQPGSATPSINNELVLSAVCYEQTDTISVDSSFTISDQFPNVGANALGGAFAYKIQTTAGPENPTFSWISTSTAVCASIASFKNN